MPILCLFYLFSKHYIKLQHKIVGKHKYQNTGPTSNKLKENLRGCRWNNWGDERGCDEGHCYARTRGLPWGLPEVVRTVQQVHCSLRGLLRRGLEFHVSTINKSAHTKKSLETYCVLLVFIFIYLLFLFSFLKKTLTIYAFVIFQSIGSRNLTHLNHHCLCQSRDGLKKKKKRERWLNGYELFLCIYIFFSPVISMIKPLLFKQHFSPS